MKKFQKGSVEIFLFVALIAVLIAGSMGIKIDMGGLSDDEEETVDLSEEVSQEEAATSTKEED